MIFYISIIVLSFILTFLVREYALRKKIIDVPNERSSHSVPTPRGGGLAIVLSFYIGLVIFYLNGKISNELFFALICSLPIVIVSLVDDIVTVSSKVRFIVQTASAALALYLLGGVNKLDFVLFKIEGEWINLLILLGMVWLINLYNFIDGIDAYAATEAIFVSIGAYILFHNEIFLLLAASVSGFLPFNWPKAKIFMGDVGSAFLGFVFAVFIVYYIHKEVSIIYWLILLALFWFDATLTLARRIKNKEPFTKPHRKHAYQRAVQAGFTHKQTVIVAMIINLVAFSILYVLKETKEIFYFFLIYIVALYFLTKFIDTKKAF